MTERRRFLQIFGASAATLALPACGASGETGDTGDGPTGAGGGNGNGVGIGNGNGGTSAESTGAGDTSATGAGGSAPCSALPSGLAMGAPADYPNDGLYKVPGTSLLIGRDAGGLYALSAICTHKSCNMANLSNGEAIGTVSAAGIRCNCHGSRFDNTGNVTKGPATKPLKAHALALSCDGALYADKAQVVPNTTRLPV